LISRLSKTLKDERREKVKSIMSAAKDKSACNHLFACERIVHKCGFFCSEIYMLRIVAIMWKEAEKKFLLIAWREIWNTYLDQCMRRSCRRS